MTLAQVIEAADRAAAEVATWPLWKQKLSYPKKILNLQDKLKELADQEQDPILWVSLIGGGMGENSGVKKITSQEPY